MPHEIIKLITEHATEVYAGYSLLTALAIAGGVIYLFRSARRQGSVSYNTKSYRNAFCVAIGGMVPWGFATILLTSGTHVGLLALILVLAILASFATSTLEIRGFEVVPRDILAFVAQAAGIALATSLITLVTIAGI
ncbi:hypothetical protein MBO12_01270 [Candidatus Saccharibacteria bacterium]|nr:hypothetical protein [Candidatus Saccharibacteria bacterium]